MRLDFQVGQKGTLASSRPMFLFDPIMMKQSSDLYFWRLTLTAHLGLKDALLLHWLSLTGAETHFHEEVSQMTKNMFDLSRKHVFTARRRLVSMGLAAARVLRCEYTSFKLDADRVLDLLCSVQTPLLDLTWNDAQWLGLSVAQAMSRIAILRQSKEEAILVACLVQVGAVDEAVLLSSRDLHQSLGDLLDRRTAMRTLNRMQDAGLVAVTPLGRKGTMYQLHAAAVRSLLSQPFPFHEDGVRFAPGWADRTFGLLEQLEVALQARADAAEASQADSESAANRAARLDEGRDEGACVAVVQGVV